MAPSPGDTTAKAQAALNHVASLDSNKGTDLYNALWAYWDNMHRPGNTQQSAAQNVDIIIAGLYLDPRTIGDAGALTLYVTAPISSVSLLAVPPNLSQSQKDFIKNRQTQPTPGNVGSSIASGVGNAVSNTFNQATGGFFKALTSKNTWIRIGEGLVGVSLLVIGVAIVAQNSPAAKGVAKVAKYIK